MTETQRFPVPLATDQPLRVIPGPLLSSELTADPDRLPIASGNVHYPGFRRVEHSSVQEDAKWSLVRDALSDEDWDFRTLRGISRDTGLSEVEVANLLLEHEQDVRQRFAWADWRTSMYTLKSRPRRWGEIFSDVLFYLSR